MEQQIILFLIHTSIKLKEYFPHFFKLISIPSNNCLHANIIKHHEATKHIYQEIHFNYCADELSRLNNLD